MAVLSFSKGFLNLRESSFFFFVFSMVGRRKLFGEGLAAAACLSLAVGSLKCSEFVKDQKLTNRPGINSGFEISLVLLWERS